MLNILDEETFSILSKKYCDHLWSNGSVLLSAIIHLHISFSARLMPMCIACSMEKP